MNRGFGLAFAILLVAWVAGVVYFVNRPLPVSVTEMAAAAASSSATIRAGRWIATRVSTVDDAVKLLQSIEPLTAARAKVFGSGAYIWVIYEDDVLQRRQRAPQK